jgi:hypothetical protein
MSAARTAEAKGGVGVSKDDKRDKEKDKKEKNGKSAVVSQTGAVDNGWVCEEVKPSGAYTDGHPLDSVQYMEAKIILKPERFTSVESFRDFGKLVQHCARELKVGFITDPKVGRRPDIREIVFMDTPDFRLYNNAFILRRRITYIDGFPVGDPEIVFKFRHPDEMTAAKVDVRPNVAGKYQIKFKAEALPLKESVGGFRILYSHNCQFGLSQMHEGDKFGMWELAHVFPALAVLKKSKDEEVRLVNESIVEEVLLELGDLDFGKGVEGHCNVALWRNRGDHTPLVGEFAYQLKFTRGGDVHDKPKRLSEQFFISLQREVQDWISLGTTKTGMVYRLKGNAPQSHE